MTMLTCCHGWPNPSSLINKLPDEPFHNFRASKSMDRAILCSSGTSCGGFQSSKVVKGQSGTACLLARLPWCNFVITTINRWHSHHVHLGSTKTIMVFIPFLWISNVLPTIVYRCFCLMLSSEDFFFCQLLLFRKSREYWQKKYCFR